MNPRGARVIRIDTSGRIEELLGDAPTPNNLDELDSDYYKSERFREIDSLLKINALRWGTLYGFANEQKGKVVQNIFPIKNDTSHQISSSSSVELELHTETAFHSERANTVFLYCLKDDPNAGTVVSQLDDFIVELNEDVKSILKQKVFKTSIDESFAKSTQASIEISTSILSDDERSITFDKTLMRGANKDADSALAILTTAITKHKKVIYLHKGEALVMHNHSTVHGRTPFQAKYDGTDRWLKRIMIRLGKPTKDVAFFGPENYYVIKTLF